MPTQVPRSSSRWREAWPDLLAFAVGLAMAWQLRWQTTDLIWSLWLSSLLVGFAMITWSLAAPAWLLMREGKQGAAVGAAIGGLVMLAFFTLHFGLFHLVHSLFLNAFFPIAAAPDGLFAPGIYTEVFERYWWFVPLAALSEREGFRQQVRPLPAEPPRTSVKAADIERRKARNSRLRAGAAATPYKNVVRLHLLIFFFAAAHFAKFDSFMVYAIVYVVYFFPWRLVSLGRAEQTP